MFCRKLIDDLYHVLLWPFEQVSAELGLLLISIITGALLLIIFKYTSNQQGIQRVKEKLKAHLLEVRLYRGDIRISIGALKNLLINNVRYISFALKPMLIMALPLIFLLVQLSARYELRPLSLNEEVIIEMVVGENVDVHNVILRKASVIDEPSPVRIPKENRIFWKIRALQRGKHELSFLYNEECYANAVIVGEGVSAIIARRFQPSDLSRFFYSPNALLPANCFIKELTIHYPKRTFNFFGIQVNWLVFFLLASLITAVSLKRLLRVEI